MTHFIANITLFRRKFRSLLALSVRSLTSRGLVSEIFAFSAFDTVLRLMPSLVAFRALFFAA